MTPRQVAILLTAQLGHEYPVDPQVDAEVKQSRSQWVMITGQAQRLGRITLRGGTRLKEVLSEAGAPPQYRVVDITLASQLRRQLANGSYRLARQTALRLLEPVPDHDFYRGQLATALLGLGQLDEAAVFIGKMMENPHDGEVLLKVRVSARLSPGRRLPL